MQQRLAELSNQLVNEKLTQDERDTIEAEIEQIEYDMDKEFNHHDHERGFNV